MITVGEISGFIIIVNIRTGSRPRAGLVVFFGNKITLFTICMLVNSKRVFFGMQAFKTL